MPGRLEGKAAIITGGASGIGRATALLFADEGASVGVLDRDAKGGEETVRLIAGKRGQAILLPADVSSEEDVRAAIGTTVEKFGRLDVLVNAAAVLLMARATETSVEDWDRLLGVNLRGIFLCCKHAIPQMQRQGGGAIVSIASIAALMAVPAHAAYDAAKAGVVGLTRQVALDYGPDNIRANCVCPTATDTPMIRATGVNDEVLRALAQKHPLRRIAQPEDIAYAVLFLASDEARCITGTALPVDAGWTGCGLSSGLM